MQRRKFTPTSAAKAGPRVRITRRALAASIIWTLCDDLAKSQAPSVITTLGRNAEGSCR